MNSRRCSAAESVARVRSGDTVLVMGCLGEPEALVDALMARTDLQGVTAYQVMTGVRGGGLRQAPPWLRVVPLVPSGTGHDSLPSSIYGISRWLGDGTLKVDVVLLQVAVPADGKASLGVCVDFMAQACRNARHVAAEVNEAMPCTQGDCHIPLDRIDAAVAVCRPLREIRIPEGDEATAVIARHCASLIPSESTLEVGVGTIPGAVLGALGERLDLAVHTGAVSDALVPLLPKLRSPVTCTQALGSRDFTRGLHRNHAFAFRPCDVTHNPLYIARIDRFVAIQSAVSVDLRGQANLETIDGRTVAGAGGAPDFARGAGLCAGGRSIVALKATANGGQVSRITAGPGKGGTVALSAQDVDYAVTEFGIAHLRGRTFRERAEALVSIAAPAFRAGLMEEMAAWLE